MPSLGIRGLQETQSRRGPQFWALTPPPPAPDGSGWQDEAGQAYACHSGRQLSAVQRAGRARPGGAGSAASCHLCLEIGDMLPAKGPQGGRGVQGC